MSVFWKSVTKHPVIDSDTDEEAVTWVGVAQQDALGTEQEQVAQIVAGTRHRVRLIDTSGSRAARVDTAETGLRPAGRSATAQPACTAQTSNI